MKNFKFTALCTATAIALGVSASAQAANDRYVIQVDESTKGLVKALTKKLGGVIKVDSNGFIAATFSGKTLSDVKGLLNNPHIKLIEEDQLRKATGLFDDDIGNPMVQQVTPYAIKQSQASDVNLQPGMKVCIIDSGLDMSSGDFLTDRVTGDNDPTGTGNWNEAGGEHGTHVAGTIAAADNGYGVVGMAPGVPLHIIKVFNAAGWAYSSDLAHAANLCGNAGANIISMSLGGGGANSTEENAFKDFTANGGLVVAAAGNDGNSVRSYPAGYSSVMMIGANDNNNNIADFSQFPGCTTGRGKKATTDETICVEVTAGGVNTLSTFPAGLATAAGLTADAVAFDTSAMENPGTAQGDTIYMGIGDTATPGLASGKVCVIDRGTISFHDKVKNCEDSSGIGAVIINNEPGMLYGTLGDASTNTTLIPAVGAAQEDRSDLMAATSMDISVTSSDYGFLSGTSMATPAVSGVAALVWSNHPTCTGSQIRQVLKDTAMDSGAAGKDDYFGYGIVQAADANAYIAENNICDGGVTPPTGGDLTLTASGYKSRGTHVVDLSWTGAASANVDVYQDGSLKLTTANEGDLTINLNTKGGGTYTFEVCEEGTSTCSETVTVNF